MAIQDDNTILNKGDLKAYHERIAPMLGGTFMVGTNNSDYYSTDEKVVGVWTDGKPVYQKTLFYASLPQMSTTPLLTGVDTITNFFQVHARDGVPECEDSFYNSSTDYFFALPVANNGNFYIYYKTSRTVTDWTITIQYTKTTDAAGSATTTPGAYDINFPNTWPANTEIFFGNGMYGYRATGNVASNKDNTLPISGVKKFYGYGGSSDNGAGANVHAFPYTNPGNMPTWGNCLWADHDNGIPHIYWGTGYTTNTTFDIWMRYTK